MLSAAATPLYNTEIKEEVLDMEDPLTFVHSLEGEGTDDQVKISFAKY